jgi:hypothetical protein
VYATIVPSHTGSGNTGVIAGGAAARASILTLFLLYFFWHRRRRHRRRQQFDGIFDFDRITKHGTGHTDTAGTDIKTYSHNPQAGAGAGIGHSRYDSELGVSHAGSGPSGLSTAIWSGQICMRQHPASQTLLMGKGGSDARLRRSDHFSLRIVDKVSLPDAEVAASTPQENPPSYDSIPGDV